MKLALALLTAQAVSGFVPLTSTKSAVSLKAGNLEFAEVGGEPWDPMGFGKLGDGETIDTFPNMFPDKQFLQESEIKQGRMAMLAWTGVWATQGLGWHFPGAPVEPDWTKALGVWAKEDPVGFGIILLLISIAEGESIGHAGDNFRGKSEKVPGDLNFDYLGLKAKQTPESAERYRVAELKNGRAAMIAMASLFAMKAIPGSVPIMDILGAN